MDSFADKVVAITGAGSGIGRALAQEFAARGARLALSSIHLEHALETAALLPSRTEVRCYGVDVAVREQVYDHEAQVGRDFGTAHCIVNNAGITVVGSMEHLAIEDIERQLAVNLWGTVYGTKAFLPRFLAQKEGCIVNLSSVFGMVGFPAQGAYNMSKFAVRGLTECLWSELRGTGVRAVCVHPGGIRTNIASSALHAKAVGAEESEFDRLAQKMLRTSPQDCAADIVKGIERGKRRIVTGHQSSSLWWLSRWLPNAYPAVLKALAR